MNKKWIILWIIFILVIIGIKVFKYYDEKNNRHKVDYNTYANIIKKDYEVLKDKVFCDEQSICYLYMNDVMETLYDLADKQDESTKDLELFTYA